MENADRFTRACPGRYERTADVFFFDGTEKGVSSISCHPGQDMVPRGMSASEILDGVSVGRGRLPGWWYPPDQIGGLPIWPPSFRQGGLFLSTIDALDTNRKI